MEDEKNFKEIVEKNGSFAEADLTKSVELKISQHEDAALKVAAQFFKDEILPFFKIKGRVIGMAPTETIYMELKKLYQDINFVLDDGSWIHMEFQSRDGGIEDLKRFRAYEAVAGYKYNVSITTYVLYSGNIKNPVTEFTEGVNTYRVVPLIMQDYDVEVYFSEIKKKIEKKETLTKKDLVPLTLCPLMGGSLTQKERIQEAFEITRKVENVEKNIIQMIESMVYTMADKFLNKLEMNEIMEGLKMTTLGQMLVNDGMEKGMEKGVKAMVESCKQLNATWEMVLDMLVEKLSLTREKAEEYMDMYW